MHNDSTNTTRRAALAALAGTVAFAGTIGAAIASPAVADPMPGEPTPEGNRLYDEAFGHGSKEGSEIALLYVARAWINRWKAAGGFFGCIYEPNGETRGFGIGWGEFDLTLPDSIHSTLPPHVQITDEAHCRGARKALEGMLELVPQLRETVWEIVSPQLILGHPAAREA
jgi:hypothetical protein